jgi:DNA-binding beta-propeller fold protein YncE
MHGERLFDSKKKIAFIVSDHMRLFIYILFFSFGFHLFICRAESQTLVWPPPPEKARIKHLQTVSSLKDVSSEPGFFSKVFSFIFGGTMVSQWLTQPVGIAISKDGLLYIADPGIKGIHILDLQEKEYSFIGETKFGTFISPVALAFAANGDLYISDSERREIIVLSADRTPLFSIKDSLVRPTGIRIFNNKLYVADAGKNKILVFSLDGRFAFEFGRRGVDHGEFNFPVQLTANDSLYVVDGMNFRIQQFTHEGKYVSSFGQIGNTAGYFANPKSIALDSDGHLYVTDALLDNFQIFDSAGKLLLVVGSKGISDGEFLSPSGIAIDSNDNIYIIDSLNKRIQIFKYLR